MRVVHATCMLAVATLAGSTATATEHQSPLRLLASGPQGSTLTATVQFRDGAEGATSRMLVVGLPGTTAEAHGATAVLRSANQLPSTQAFGETSISVRVSPAAPGIYPVFAFAARELGCASSNMHEPSDLTIVQVGIVRVSSALT